MRIIILAIFCASLVACMSNTNELSMRTTSTKKASFNELVCYSEEEYLDFSEFSLKFIGAPIIKSNDIGGRAQVWLFDIYAKRSSTGDQSYNYERYLLPWSGGGVITPVEFRVFDKQYVLERHYITGREMVAPENCVIVWEQKYFLGVIKK